ncbi:MAG: sigma-70 family RNA polymerase sigma factor [Phycisphaerales bacterium]|nr:sigma-70 family RNA polymerase sigma factor [Phycisphaerales bacterium]
MPEQSPENITRLICAAQDGDAHAGEELLPLVYEELRRLASSHLAREPSGITLQPTALVHEAYLKLLGAKEIQWQGQGHFFAAAAQAMRRILVDRARARNAIKRGGDRHREQPEEGLDALPDPLATPGGESGSFDLLQLNSVLTRLETRDRRQADVVMMRYFAGLTIEQTAQALGISTGTVKNEWTFARAWLRRELDAMDPGGEPL